MPELIEQQINLFADELPSMDDFKSLSAFINSGESNRAKFIEELENNLSKTSPSAKLAAGIGLCMVGRYQEAIENLESATDCMEKHIYLARAYREAGRYEQAVNCYDESLKKGADKLNITLEKAETFRRAGDFETAESELKSCSNFDSVSADYHFQLGRLYEIRGLYDKAAENYEKAIELAPQHQKALFHLAYRCDLSGDESAAIDYYRQIASYPPVRVSALLNLAVLYEDIGAYNRAAQCVDKVLKFHPNHQRALLFKKDIESSKTMFYDEEKEKRKSRKNQILEMPISDFELSVRSRNCLRKMKIHTLGDLLRISEAELLSYKNFGETSLREIKKILESKSLNLGMSIEDKQSGASAAYEDADSEEPSAEEKLLARPVDDLQLSVRAKKCLENLNLRSLNDLTRKTDAELLGVKNFGATSLNEIKRALEKFGLSLRKLE